MEKKGTMVPAAATAARFPRFEWKRMLLLELLRSARGPGTFMEGAEIFRPTREVRELLPSPEEGRGGLGMM